MKLWNEPLPVSVPPELAAAVGGHPLVAETLVRRGIKLPHHALAFIDPARYSPCPASAMPGIERAVNRLAQGLTRGERIGVWGDFDVDGQTATTLLVSALRELGAEVVYHIPVRANESHGVNLPQLKELLSQRLDILITCDTGIAAHEAIGYAQNKGVDVILTDHHELPPTLPPAFSITNPRLLPDGHPLSSLPGVGVAYKLVEGLFDYYQPREDARRENVERFLDLVALGIVADVAALTGDARFLLQRGLETLRNTGRVGLQAIYAAADLNPRGLNEEDIAFSIAPRLNAIGRLADANPVVELLTTNDHGRAHTLAAQIEAHNDRRKLLTNQVFQGALAQIKASPELLDEAALVLSNPHWPPGVIGIVASRLVERFDRPVVLFACPPGESARGSARSVAGVHITQAFSDALAGITATENEHRWQASFGGHAAAAGLSLNPERIPDFRRRLSRAITQLSPDRPPVALPIDGWLPFSDLSLDLVADLERLSPFGASNPPLILAASSVRQVSAAPLGRTGEHVQVIVEDAGGQTQRIVWWQGAVELDAEPLPAQPFDLAYTVRASSFGGQRQVQVEWIAHRVIQDNSLEITTRQEANIVDHRQAAYPLAELQQLRSRADLLVWAEGEARQILGGQNRMEIQPAHTLVIWTIPPGRKELEAALATASPAELHLFAVDPQLDQLETFLRRLAGLIKHSQAQGNGAIHLPGLAAAMAHRMGTVRAGMTWFERKGYIALTIENDEIVHVTEGANQAALQSDIEAARARLLTLLEETAAFRAFYRRAQPETFMATSQKLKNQGGAKR